MKMLKLTYYYFYMFYTNKTLGKRNKLLIIIQEQMRKTGYMIYSLQDYSYSDSSSNYPRVTGRLLAGLNVCLF